MITDYLAALGAELELPSRRRHRILAEVEDHLLCAAADLHAGGLSVGEAERQAVARFGESSELARIFTAEQAARTASWLGRLTLGLGALVAFSLAPARGLPGGSLLAGVVAFTLVQVALATGVLTWWRARAARAAGALAAPGLELIRRGAFVVAGAAALGTVDIVAHIPFGAVPASALVGGALSAAGGATCLTVARRARRLAVAGPVVPDPVLRASGAVARWVARRSPRFARWVDLVRRPWRVAVLVAVAAGLALAGGHGVAEGLPSELWRGLLAGGVLASIEAALALSGFAVLGRFLGLRD